MTKLTIINIVGWPNGFLNLNKGSDEALKDILAVNENLLRIDWKCMKIALII